MSDKSEMDATCLRRRAHCHADECSTRAQWRKHCVRVEIETEKKKNEVSANRVILKGSLFPLYRATKGSATKRPRARSGPTRAKLPQKQRPSNSGRDPNQHNNNKLSAKCMSIHSWILVRSTAGKQRGKKVVLNLCERARAHPGFSVRSNRKKNRTSFSLVSGASIP